MPAITLSKNERLALLGLISAMQPEELEATLFGQIGVSVTAFGSLMDPMPKIAFKFVQWALERPQEFGEVVEALCEQYQQRPELPTLRIIQKKILTLLRRAPANPCDAYLLGSAVMANRSQLRDMLGQLVLGYARPLIRVAGPPGSGRSQSWHLIRHVAKEHGVLAKRLDLDGWVVEQRTLCELASSLVTKCGLPGLELPTTEGATPETLGQRFASRVSECLEQRPPGVSLWLVFDSLDRNLAPEIGAFIRRLVELALQGTFDDCTVFLLGPSGDVDAPASAAVLSENLGPFLESEIEEAARIINDAGASSLDEASLLQRVSEMKLDLNRVSSTQQARMLSERLTELRYAVEAP